MVCAMPRNPSINIQRAVDDYLAGLPLARKTMTSRRCSLRALLKVTGPHILVSSVDERHIHEMFVANADNWMDSTKRLNQTNIKLFFEWCRDMGYAPMNWNPLRARRARAHGGTVREHRYISEQEMAGVLLATPYPRDRALAAGAWFTMCRSVELKSIRIRNVNLDAGHIVVQITKTGKITRKPIAPAYFPMLTGWLDEYRELLRAQGEELRPEHYLFPSRTTFPIEGRTPDGKFHNDGRQYGSRLRPEYPVSDIHKLFHEILANAGITGEWMGGHTFRRSAAREMFFALRAMGDNVDSALIIVGEMLNHSSTLMTQRYLGVGAGQDMLHQVLHRDGINQIPVSPVWEAALGGNVIPIGRKAK